MVGFVQKVCLDLVEARGGEEAVLRVREMALVPEDRLFRIGEVYADDEFQRLVGASLKVLNLTEEQYVELYADHFCRDAEKRFKKWFELAQNSRQFLEFQTTIHNTFATSVVDPLDRQAVKDKFKIQTVDDRNIVTHYRSLNKLCKLYRALGRWMAAYYNDEIEFSEPKCQLQGDEECEIHVKWTRIGKEDGLFNKDGVSFDDHSVLVKLTSAEL
jgi:hypothetical protein